MPCFILQLMENLRITTVQSMLHWEGIATNLHMFGEKTAMLKGRTDLIVLPEMFTTGFSMNAAAVAEKMDGTAVHWMRDKSAELDAVITGSLIIEEGGRFFNRLIWMQPDGQLWYYDKRHLFTLAKEHETYTAGTKKLTVKWKGWKICPLICYDLRFPVWSRNAEDYDLLVYVANWPEKRSYHWRQLLIARAIENQCYTIGVNRTGEDKMGFQYTGDTSVVDYSGKVVYRVSEAEDVFTFILSKEKMNRYREKLNFLNDRDKFEIL